MVRELIKYLPVGAGTGGDEWDDGTKTGPPIVGVRSVRVRHGEHVSCLQVTYILADDNLHTALARGDDAGSVSTFTLDSSEAIVRVEGKVSGSCVGQIVFTTRTAKGEEKTHGPYGKTGDAEFCVQGYIVSFLGYSDVTLVSLGVRYLPPLRRSIEVGLCTREAFEDPVWTLPLVQVKSISLKHDGRVNIIQCTYEMLGGRRLTCGKHGNSTNGVQSSTVDLEDGEEIVEVKGRTNGAFIGQLAFVTKKMDGSRGFHGPYGESGDTEFSVQVDGCVMSFFGHSGDCCLEGIGVYYV